MNTGVRFGQARTQSNSLEILAIFDQMDQVTTGAAAIPISTGTLGVGRNANKSTDRNDYVALALYNADSSAVSLALNLHKSTDLVGPISVPAGTWFLPKYPIDTILGSGDGTTASKKILVGYKEKPIFDNVGPNS